MSNPWEFNLYSNWETINHFQDISFFQWGMDILRPLLVAKGQRKFLLVTIDYFTKWLEVESLATSRRLPWRVLWGRILYVGLTNQESSLLTIDNHEFKAFCIYYHRPQTYLHCSSSIEWAGKSNKPYDIVGFKNVIRKSKWALDRRIA